MKLRCPYCKGEFPPQNGCTCPSCGKVMRIAQSFRKTVRIAKKPLASDYQQRRRERLLSTPGRLSRNPRILLAVVAAMFIVGGLLLRRAHEIGKLTKADLPEPEKTRVACRELLCLGKAVREFHTDMGRYPTTTEGLSSLVTNPGISNWARPYLIVPSLHPWKDPWKNAYYYSCSNGTVRLFSTGPDGKSGTDDDLISPYFRPAQTNRIEAALKRWEQEHRTVIESTASDSEQ